ncbi:MAG: M20/M25/M40 family metallo-hydrolase [Saprospiraceae bacterium]|nr:M20/M25/M40 family metallo-hydrolase [Lewinella sp.]
MKKLLLFAFLFVTLMSLRAQQSPAGLPEFAIDRSQVESQLRYLASDELKGRRTGSEGNNIAAKYIADRLQELGYTSPEGADQYFQKIPFVAKRPPKTGSLKLGDLTFTQGKDLIMLDGVEKTLETIAVFAGYGWVDETSGRDDYKGLNVEGKVVIVLSGKPESSDPSDVFNAMGTKRKLAAERGAAALVEVYTLSYPWQFFSRYFGRERIEPGEVNQDEMLYAWIQGADKKAIADLRAGHPVQAEFTSGASNNQNMASQNVIGVLEGSDPELKEEYMLLTAHYDHVGTGKQGGGAYGPRDSIFNGARDNAMGVVALLTAAEALAKDPPKRSVIILAVTAEEIGLLGSQYYADHPLIPLEKTIFNINTDGAGFNITDGVALIGWNRTGTDKWVEMGLNPFGLEVIPEPAREQNLFDRSDNVSFARKGVPCLTFSPGFREFDRELMQYYHQVTDEADSMDFDYVLKFCRAFAYTSRLIADSDIRPMWVKGDKYEAAGKMLYQQK